MTWGDVGSGALRAALPLALWGVVSAAFAARERDGRFLGSARWSALCAFVLVAAASAAMVGALLSHDFSLQYVALNNARETAAQAQNDRTTILNLYLLLVGGVGSIIVGLGQARGLDLPRNVYAIVFALLGLIGFFTLFKLVRLRQAWYDSVLAMNQIKDFYLERFPELDKAFRWRTRSIPPPDKVGTITFNLALLVAIIDSVAVGIAAYFLNLRLANNEYLVGAFAAILFLLWQIWFYFFQLREK